jgi:hypothetical protein
MVDIGILRGKFYVVHRICRRCDLAKLCAVAEGEEQDGENVSAARHAEENVVKKENERDVEEGGRSGVLNEDNMFCSTFPKVEQK